MDKFCKKCGCVFKDKPSGRKVYCGRVCATKQVTADCLTCGKEVTRAQSSMLKEVYCNMACAKVGKSKRFTKMNIEMNPDRMTLEVRTKLRFHRLGKGEGKSYEKTFGVHTHRIVAAEKIGRPLKKGEVVHHKDENRRNNNPDNLHVFSSQAEHARHHKEQESVKRK